MDILSEELIEFEHYDIACSDQVYCRSFFYYPKITKIERVLFSRKGEIIQNGLFFVEKLQYSIITLKG